MPRVLESRPEFYNFIMSDTDLDLTKPKEFVLPPLTSVHKEQQVSYRSFARSATATEFIRIFNVKKFFSESCATARITPEQYMQAQELGLTLHHDEALTAKVIGILGQYRLQVLKAQEELGIRTTLFSEKEMLCQHTIKRVRLLQIIERMHGASTSQLRLAVAQYKSEVADEIAQLTSKLKALKEKREAETNQTQLLSLQIKALNSDLQQVDQLSSLVARKSQESERGTDTTRNPVAHFIKQRINAILATAREANEVLTLASASSGLVDKSGAFFRGFFHTILSRAWLVNRDALWDQQRAILPQHQGDYSGGASHITVHSTQLLGKGKSALKDFLFGMNLIVLNPTYKPSSAKSPSGVKTYTNRSHSSWFFRLLSKLRGGRRGTKEAPLEIDSYYKMLEQTTEARQNIFISFIDDARHGIYTFASWIVRTLEVTGLNFIAILKEIVDDFRWDLVKQSEVTHVHASESLPPRPHEEIVRTQLELFTWLRLPIGEQASETLVEKLDIPHAEVPYNRAEDAYLQTIRALIDKMATAAPMAQPFYHLRPYSPSDAFSKLMDSLENFYTFFAAYYETCPSVALYSSAIYLLSAAAILNPALMGQIDQALNFINTWSSVTAQAMSKSAPSQIVAAGFSGFKEVLLSLQLVTDGADSTLAHALQYIQAHLPQVILGGAALAGAGFGLSSLGEIPVIGSESGNIRGLEEGFVAAKAGAIAYEGLHSNHREASIAARTITAVLRIPALVLRLILSPFNALHKLTADALLRGAKDRRHFPPSWQQVGKPWSDLAKAAVTCVLILLDIGLRLLNLLGMGLKLVPKLLADWLINNSATALNHFQMLMGAALGIGLSFFLLPHLSLIPLLAIGFASAFVVQTAFWSLGLNLKVPYVSKLLLQAKHATFGFFDRLNRPIKQLYEAMRNQIARWMMSEKMSGEKALATYQLLPKLSPSVGRPSEVVMELEREGSLSTLPPIAPVPPVRRVVNPLQRQFAALDLSGTARSSLVMAAVGPGGAALMPAPGVPDSASRARSLSHHQASGRKLVVNPYHAAAAAPAPAPAAAPAAAAV